MACTYNYKTSRLQFVVGDPSSVVTDLPDGSYTIPDSGGSLLMFMLNVVQDSVEVYSEGSIMPRAILDQQSYTVIYTQSQTAVEFYTGPDNPGLQPDTMIIVRLNYLDSI